MTLLLSLIALAGTVGLLGAGMRQTDNIDQLVGDSAAAEKIRQAADFGENPTEHVVLTTRSGKLTDETVRALTGELRATYTGVEGVLRVGEPFVGPARGNTLVVPVELQAATSEKNKDPGQLLPEEAVAPMLEVTERLADRHPELEVGQVGDGSIDREVGRQLEGDFHRAELISVPITLCVLLVAFGAVVAAFVPVLLGVIAVAAGMGLTALVSRELLPVDSTTQSIMMLIGLAVGVDYALFVLRRSREERDAGAGREQAVATAGATAGRAVVVSGITVVIAMSGMLVAGGLFTSVAIGAMIVVIVAVLASATLLPALLGIFGDKVEALRLPFSARRAARRGTENSFWGRLAGRVSGRPVIWGTAAAGVLIALAVPALGMKTSLSGVEGLPDGFDTVSTYKRLTAAVPQDGTTVDVVVQAPADSADDVRAALTSAFPTATGTGKVSGGKPEITASEDRTVHVMEMAVPMEVSDPALGELSDTLRRTVVGQVERDLAGVPGARVHLGGAADGPELTEWMDERIPWVVGFVLVLTFVVMVLSFGSPWLAAATVGLNLLSVGAAYGTMTLVFQHTWAEGLLGFSSIGSIAAWLPLLMFVILFGLSMDYHVFVVSRVREAYRAGADPRQAVRSGVARSAGVVTSAAAVMVAVFAIFATLSQLELKQMGVGLSAAVLLDATLVRGVLLPAVLTVLGERAHRRPRWVPALNF
jgi:putative drug exporter of the RND superfamily